MSKIKEKIDSIREDIESMKQVSDNIDALILALENILKGRMESVRSLKELEKLVLEHKTMRDMKGCILGLDPLKFRNYHQYLRELKNVPIKGIKEALEKEKSKMLKLNVRNVER